MADSRRYPLQTHLDIGQIVQDAQIRWLRPNEICEIIRNYPQFQLTPDPPFRPPGGSLFLFDRKALRYFRKDGHNWRKKKDGKTVREAHEKLKCGSINVLHCYYAHGENNENFQRRSYWMLDVKLEHIVLVHYRDVHDANKPSMARVLSTSRDQKRLTPPNVQSEPCTYAQANSNPNPNTCAFQEDSVEDVGGPFTSVCEDIPFMSSDSSSSSSSMLVNHFSLQDFILSSGQHMILSPPPAPNSEAQSLLVKSEWPNFLMPQPNIMSFQIQKGDRHLTPPPPPPPPPPVFIGDTDRRDQMRKEQMGNEAEQPPTEIHDASYEFKDPIISCDTSYEFKGPISCDTSCEFKGLSSCDEMDNDDRALQKMDSFGRWMNSEMGRDCDDSLMAATASESCDYWNALDDTKEVISRHIMQLDSDVCPSLSQEQLFTIIDFSPDWSYADGTQETRVLISGKFLGSFDPQTIRWGCMFGETEVPAEVLTSSGGTMRCVVPPVTSPSRVPFYITRSNRLACSEIREFEFRVVPPKIEIQTETQEEFQLQVRLAKLLSADKWPVCSVAICSKCDMKRNSSQVVVTGLDGREGLIGRLMKDRLLEWVSYKLHKEEQDGTRENILDEGGQGVIHLVAALGYDWAMGPIVKSGISPSFRDARGWTALHWAAYYGREDTVSTLVKLGSDPAAVEDPTSKCPIGSTAADVASSRGYKGIAGFLAEAHLTSHLSSLTIHVKEDDLPQDDDDALNLILEQTGAGGGVDQYEDDISIKRSLEALRNSAQAAARIRAAFRVNSFRLRQAREKEERGGKDDVDELLDHVAMVSSSSSSSCSSNRFKMNNNTQIGGEREPLHCLAALKIQRKYRGWKGRREYLKMRNKIVKIQAHVRGHQVRKQYKKVVWSVSIVEKAILRWRRKGSGLRGFRSRAPQVMIDDEYDYLSLGRRQKEVGLDKALATVRSMARSPQARHQYMRLLFTSHQI